MSDDLRLAIDAARARLDPTSGDQAELGLLRAEVERLTAMRDEAYTQHDDFRAAVSDALAPLGVWYMDLPDGGNVDQPEFISRAVDDLLHLRTAVARLQARERELEAALTALATVSTTPDNRQWPGQWNDAWRAARAALAAVSAETEGAS